MHAAGPVTEEPGRARAERNERPAPAAGRARTSHEHSPDRVMPDTEGRPALRAGNLAWPTQQWDTTRAPDTCLIVLITPEAAHSAGRPHRRAAPTKVRPPPNEQSARLHTGVSIGSWKRTIGRCVSPAPAMIIAWRRPGRSGHWEEGLLPGNACKVSSWCAGIVVSGYRPFARATAAVIACGSGLTTAPATRTVGVALTPATVARAVTYGGQSR